MAMKVAVITNEYPTVETPTIGTFVRLNAQAIGSRNEVTVIHLRNEAASGTENHYVDENVDVRAFPNAMRTQEDFERAAQIIYSLAPGFDVLHTMNLWSLLPFGLPNRQDEQLACAWVHTEPWQVATPADWPHDILPVEEILLRPDGLTAPAVKMLREIADKRFASYTAAVPYIVPSPAYGSLPGETGTKFVERPRQKGALRLVSAGAVTSRHRPESAIRTVKTLRAQGIDARLTWVGEGAAKVRSLEKVKDMGLDSCIEFVSPETISSVEAIDAADLFIGPTKEENFYLPALQALLAGRPLVLGMGAADLEYVNDDTSEVITLVKEQNSKFWAAACLELQEKTLAMSAAEVAGAVGERYSPVAIALEYDEVYAETIAASGFAQ